ncbi:MAG: MiaB/RimO family radical SAM methylthiotransferase [Mailhella sp.]|nr:MiaB/RimO family radical SAM methylthiotransferase [Mailhella sp.]
MRTFTFYMITYGCRVNQYEAQAVRELWTGMGGSELDTPDGADVILLSSCAVTAEAVSDARQMARKLSREHPSTRIFAAGCASTAEPADFSSIPGVVAIPQTAKYVLLDRHPLDDEALEIPDGSEKIFAPFAIRSFKRARPVVKIEDGCSQGCAYCIVPLTRGPARSRPVSEILAETRRLLESGHREIQLSGINLRQFHTDDKPGGNFWTLLQRMEQEFSGEWGGKARFRLSSLDPAQVISQECLDTLSSCSMVCPHLHLSLQSGSPSVLRRMGRSPYSPESVARAVEDIMRSRPVLGLGADILMGFPGETEQETEETLSMIRALPFTYAHVFPYSQRPGTRAASMPDQLPRKVRQEHAARVRTLIAEKHAAFLAEQLKMSSMSVAFDGADGRHGNNEMYADCRLEPDGGGPLQGHELVCAVPLRIENGLIVVRRKG